MKRILLSSMLILMTFIALTSCGRKPFDNPFNPSKNSQLLDQATLGRVMSGSASRSDIMRLVTVYDAFKPLKVQETPNSIITIPKTGRLLVTLRDNDAGWKSEVYMTIGNQTTMIIADTRNGPLNVTSEFAYQAGTEVSFYLITYTKKGAVITNRADSVQCRVDYDEMVPKWVLNFEDTQSSVGTPDWDYNDCVIEVQMAPALFQDLSEYLTVNIDYLDHHGLNEDGYAIYYIGETMKFRVNILPKSAHELFVGKKYVVYATHEYFTDITCDRWWYPSPPRPANEPQQISVRKGDPLPGDSTQFWKDVVFTPGIPVALDGTHTSTLATCAGNDQTHLMIVSEDDQGQIELMIYDNPEAGVFDPPAK